MDFAIHIKSTKYSLYILFIYLFIYTENKKKNIHHCVFIMKKKKTSSIQFKIDGQNM